MKRTVTILGLLICSLSTIAQNEKPRVFVFTDINIDQGDPDDRESLVHLLWYANELNIEGTVPDRWGAQGYEACMVAMEAYGKDYDAINMREKEYPSPEELERLVATDLKDAKNLFIKVASADDNPLYVLIWGAMQNFGNILRERPELYKNIRVITIGTDLMIEEYRKHIPESWPTTEKPCAQYN